MRLSKSARAHVIEHIRGYQFSSISLCAGPAFARPDQRMALRPRIWLTPLHSAEWIHAVERQVFQKNLSIDQAQQVYIEFDRDRESGIRIQVALPEATFVACCDLSRRYTARLGNRTLDTLHVASALELKAASFWTFDERQSRLARAVGLKTD